MTDVYQQPIAEMLVWSRVLTYKPSRFRRVVGWFFPAWIKRRVQWFDNSELTLIYRYFAKRYGIHVPERKW